MRFETLCELWSPLTPAQKKTIASLKYAVGIVVISLISAFIVYMIWAFISMELNPVLWGEGGRAMAVFVWFVFSLFGSLMAMFP